MPAFGASAEGRPRLIVPISVTCLGLRARILARNSLRLAPHRAGAGQVVSQRQRKQYGKKKEAGDDDCASQLFAGSFDVHEEQDHERGLDGGDEESNNWIERAEVDEGRAHRGRRQDQQGDTYK